MRVAVLPVETLGGTEGPALRAALGAAFARDLPGAAMNEGAVDAAVAADTPAARPASQPASASPLADAGGVAPASPAPPACASEPACPRRVGRRLGAGHVLAVTVASLARTHVLRARVVSTDETIAERELSETVVGGREALTAALDRFPIRLFPPPPPRWYRRWWIWVGAAAVVGAASTTAVVLTRDGGRRADIVVPLP